MNGTLDCIRNPNGIYIHWPFCLSKCPYCDFNSHVRVKYDESTWIEGVIQELTYYANRIIQNSEIQTIFFGGGTPSLLSPHAIHTILNAIHTLFKVDSRVEITLEANPTTFERAKFIDFKRSGINRLSIGVQSLTEDGLSVLGRTHDTNSAKVAVLEGIQIFKNVSFDLIYGRPHQHLSNWKIELIEALKMGAPHMSLYQLTIESGTRFEMLYAANQLPMPNSELQAEFYELTNQLMNQAGFNQYEISNYAMSLHECRHNLLYWNYADYIGVGPGAHGRIYSNNQKWATSTEKMPEKWLNTVLKTGNGIIELNPLSTVIQCQEALMMGLRLQNGVLKSNLPSDWQTSINIFKLDQFKKSGIIIEDEMCITASDYGRSCLNQVLSELLCVLPN